MIDFCLESRFWRAMWKCQTSFVATVEAVLLGSFMLAPLLQFPSTLLEAVLNRSTETSLQPSPIFCSHQQPAFKHWYWLLSLKWTTPKKPRTLIMFETSNIWNIEHADINTCGLSRETTKIYPAVIEPDNAAWKSWLSTRFASDMDSAIVRSCFNLFHGYELIIFNSISIGL